MKEHIFTYEKVWVKHIHQINPEFVYLNITGNYCVEDTDRFIIDGIQQRKGDTLIQKGQKVETDPWGQTRD